MSLKQEQDEMWDTLRAHGDLAVDTAERKVGMPWAVPYQGVCFPVDVNGKFQFIAIPTSDVERFARALIEVANQSQQVDIECDAEIAAYDAICKAKGV